MTWRDIHYQSADGLDLYARDYGPQGSEAMPVLCLSGLTRNSRDFHFIAQHMAASRRVLAPDYRGRGRSAYAGDWATYSPDVEMGDAIALLDLAGIERAVVLGTSRGGLIAMLMGIMQAHRLAGVILNDVGPVLETEGLLRIAGYLGKPVILANWDEAVARVKATNTGFTALSEADWMAFARQIFRKDDQGRILPDYDPALLNTFPSVEDIKAGHIPQIWEMFASFMELPVCALRGENSDLLSAATHAKMAAKIPGLDAVTIAGRGHTPLLNEPEAVAAIDRLLARADGG